MIADLAPYPAMKGSGVPWLGEVPRHWEMTRLGYSASLVVPMRDKPEDLAGDIPWVRIEDSSGRYVGASRSRQGVSVDTVRKMNLKVFPAGTVLCSCSCSMGATAIAKVPLVSNQTFIGIIPGQRLESEYVYWLMQVSKDHLTQMATGAIQQYLSRNDFSSLTIAVPPIPEQAAIVRFLDHVDRGIGRYVRAKQKLIGVLEEQKQAIIHRAVTRGLDPSVRLKPSGVEWLGQVPGHWEVMPIKRAFLSMDYGISESASDAGPIRLLTMGDLKDGRVTVPASGGVGSVTPSLLLQAGDLLFNRTNSPDLVGKVGLFVGHESAVTFASYLVRMRPRPNHVPEFLNAVLGEATFLAIARREAIPSLHQSNLNPTRYGRLQVALPPQGEQHAVLQVLQRETGDLVRGIETAQREVALLREYRTRLIADVVTGKLDVRETAARLPEEAVELDPLDEGDTLNDTEEVATDDPDAVPEEAVE